MAEIIVVHGFAGSGKSTQCQRAVQQSPDSRRVVHVSAGDRLRDIRSGSAASRFSDIINSPQAPSPLDDYIVTGAILELILPPPVPILALVDGYPRREETISNFLDSAQAANHSFLGCISLEVTLETSVNRILSRGARNGENIRANSLEAFAVQRYVEHSTRTLQTIDRLAEIAPVIRVQADANVESVQHDFLAAIGKLAVIDPLQHYSRGA